MPVHYHVFGLRDSPYGIAYIIGYDDVLYLPEMGCVGEWRIPTMELRKGPFSDYPPSDWTRRVCSEKLRAIIEEFSSQDDELQWLPVLIRQNEEERRYYILHFPSPPDVLEKSKCIFNCGGGVVKAVLSKKASQNHKVFSHPGNMGGRWFVSGEVRRAIRSAGCTNITFSRAPEA